MVWRVWRGSLRLSSRWPAGLPTGHDRMHDRHVRLGAREGSDPGLAIHIRTVSPFVAAIFVISLQAAAADRRSAAIPVSGLRGTYDSLNSPAAAQPRERRERPAVPQIRLWRAQEPTDCHGMQISR